MNDIDSARSDWTWLAWLIVAAMLVAAALLLYRVDPTTVDWLPKCPLHYLTGWHCPGCGITRAGHALLHGDVQGALAKNPLVILGGPFLLGFCFWKRRRQGRGWSTKVSARAILALLGVLIVFAVLRNLPGYPFELLAPH
jgi:hypothetical protein